MPSQESPGAGLTCLRPSLGSPWEVHLCTPDSEGVPEVYVDKNIKFLDYSSSRNYLSYKFLITKRLSQIIDNFLLFFFIVKKYKKHKPSILICYGMLNFIGSYFYCKFSGTKLVISLHNITELKVITRSKILTYLIKHCLEIWVCSKELENSVISDLGMPVFYRSTGYDPSSFYNLNKKTRFANKSLISVGSFKWKKNYSQLISAFKILNEENKNLTLTLIGSGGLESELKQQVRNLKLEEQVNFLGMLSQIEILSKLNESSLFILPSVAEGRPKVVAEALATGLPCVVSSACNCDDLVEGAGIIINNLSPNSIADSISSVLSEPETWKKMSENAEINAKTSAWNVIARNEQDRITKILELETLNFNRT
tara:strand:- start:3804 stop:4910 length:1107 start_codon:yes stop_codon:yes gene_type:complete